MATNVVMSGQAGEYVELANRPGLTPKGRLFKKKILHMGSFAHPNVPGKKITVDEAFAKALVTNFSNGVCDIVQVPIVDGANKHVEDPLRNLGRVVDVDYDADGVYAYIDAMKHADDLGKTLIGASAMMDLNYTDTTTGAKAGPTLLHVAVTNRPYITNLKDFEEVVSASADTSSETVLLGAVNDTEENESMTKEELIAALKKEHDIDVDALLAADAGAGKDELAALSNVLGTESDLTLNDVAEAVLELSNKNEEQATLITELVAERDTLRLSRAEDEIDGLIQAGRILPKQREVMVKLSMTDRETFESLLPEESIVSLSESGVTTHQDSRSDKTQEDLNRYYEMIGIKADEAK